MNKEVLIFTGSPREDSYGASLARAAARGVRQAGGRAEIINLAELKLNGSEVQASVFRKTI